MSTVPADPAVGTAARWLDPQEQATWRAYLRMTSELAAHLNRALQTTTDLSHADFAVLVQLSEEPCGRLRGGELGRALQWEKSRLSHQLTRMERRGLVAREECPTDRRGAFIVLTDAGRAAVEAAAPGHVAEVRRVLFDGLSDDEVATLRRIAEQVVERVGTDPSAVCGGDDTGC